MNHDTNSAYTYYGWCSRLPYRTIFFPVQPYLETVPLSELPVKRHIVDKLEWQLHCRSIGDVLDLSDREALDIRGLGVQAFYELRDALFQATGNVIEDHEYFYNPDVQAYLLLLEEGIAPKSAVLDSRKWMAEKYDKEQSWL